MEPTAVYNFLEAVDLAMAQEGLNGDTRAAVIYRLIYGDRRGFIPVEEKNGEADVNGPDRHGADGDAGGR